MLSKSMKTAIFRRSSLTDVLAARIGRGDSPGSRDRWSRHEGPTAGRKPHAGDGGVRGTRAGVALGGRATSGGFAFASLLYRPGSRRVKERAARCTATRARLRERQDWQATSVGCPAPVSGLEVVRDCLAATTAIRPTASPSCGNLAVLFVTQLGLSLAQTARSSWSHVGIATAWCPSC